MLKLPFNTLVLRHWREAGRSTNSGQLVTSCIANAKVVDMQEESYKSLSGYIPKKANVWLLFPESVDSAGQVVVPSRKGLPHPLPDTIVVVDGKWSEASKMASQLKHMPRFTPLYGPHAADRLLARPHAEAQATAEAISSIVRELSPQAADCLAAEFAKFVAKAKKASGSTVKKNPLCKSTDFAPGTRVRDIRYRQFVGTVIPQNYIDSTYLSVIWDLLPTSSQTVACYNLQKIGPLEELALTAKQNPDRDTLQPGTRVKVWLEGVMPKDSFGTLQEQVLKGLYRVLLDSGLSLNVYKYSFDAVSPAEELAALGKEAKKNPHSLGPPPDIVVGQRVRYIPARCKATVLAVNDENREPVYEVKLDRGGKVFWTRRIGLELLNDMELLADVKKNPNYTGFKAGDHVRLNAQPHVVGIVLRSDAFGPVLVQWEGRGTIEMHPHVLERVPPMEALAHVAKAWKNPKGTPPATPVPPNLRDRLDPGTRVLVKGNQTGTICPKIEQPRNPDWYMVDVEGRGWRCFARNDLQALSPMEELALVAKTYKNPAEKLNKGDRVQRLYGPYKSRIGTVTSLNSRSHFGTTEITACVLFDGSQYALEYPVDQLKKVTPLEELASAAKKNPKAFQEGDRIRPKPLRPRRFSSKRTGTVTATAIGGWIRIHWDGEPEPADSNYLANDMELIPPLEDLAAVAKTYKNPRFKMLDVGERVRHTSRPKLRLGTIQQDPYSASTWYIVAFDDGKTEYLHVSELERPTPLEELAAMARKPR